jgi:hypothetical protein
MLTKSRVLTLVAGAGLAFTAFAGTAGAIDTVDDEIANNPCAQHHDQPQCQGSDEPDDPGFHNDDLPWCFSLDPATDCADPPDGEPEPDDDDIPSADPADAVAGAPTFTG